MFTVESFKWHLENIRGDEAHTAALWTLLGVDSAELQDNEHTAAWQRAHERGWQLL